MRRYRFALRPGWLVLHVITLALAVTMVLLGRWQLDVSDSKHFSLQNFGYAIQWWLFTAFALFLWTRLLRDGARRGGVPVDTGVEPAPPADEPVTYRRYVMPSAVQPADNADPHRAAYNDYLADLARRDAQS